MLASCIGSWHLLQHALARPLKGSDAKPVLVEPCRSLAVPGSMSASSWCGAHMVAVQAVLVWGAVEIHTPPRLYSSFGKLLCFAKFEERHQRAQPVIAAQHSAV